MLKKWLREPLVHFLFIGGLLFFVYSLQNDGFSDQSKRIIFTKADINRLSLMWQKQRQRPPTQVEMKGLIEQQIREQVMYREALAMGLDQNDSIVRRRLAQKVEFISADLAALIEPSEKDLAEYLAAHSDKFEIPARLSFDQIYLSTDKRGAGVEDDVARLLAKLEKAGSGTDITKYGDRFMLGQQHVRLTEHDVARLFGKDFASQLFTLAGGTWLGPIKSGYGLHLVRIDDKTAARQPELKMVQDKVRNEWMNQQRRTIDKAFYQSLRQRYEIVIEDFRLIDASIDSGQREKIVSAR